MLISYNKVFIKSSNTISNDYASQLSVIDDTFLYYLSQQDDPKGNYENLDYEYIETLKKDRAIILKNQKIFEKKKDKMNFLGLLFWQSKLVFLGFILLLIGVPIFFYMYLYRDENSSFQLPLVSRILTLLAVVSNQSCPLIGFDGSVVLAKCSNI